MASEDYKKTPGLERRGRVIKGKELGRRGEELAVGFLKKRGYKIIERNYRCRRGEIDIVAQDKKEIVFIEVKTRRSLRYGLPEEAISFYKREHIIKVGLIYLQQHRLEEVNARFDVVSISMEGEKVKEIRLIKNAFEGRLK